MEFFELTPADIAGLDDGALREFVARLTETELIQQGLPRSSVYAGGAQEAADGGLDVTAKVSGSLKCPNFVPRGCTGFQVKKHSMSRSSCTQEMKDKNGLKPSIRAIAQMKGAYIIVSGRDNCSPTMLADRIAGMKAALAPLGDDEELQVDFYGADRLALWVKDHPGVALWARARLGKPIAGWRSFGRWAATPLADLDEFLADDHPCVIDGSSMDKSPKPLLEGIQLTRDRLRTGTRAVRITGLSGVGKTRFAQALFEEAVGHDSLPAPDVLYADLGEELEPSASGVMTYLIANRLAAYVVLDNCPPDVHRTLQKQLAAGGSRLHLLTIEYDISDDRPEETDVVHIEPGSEEMVAKLLRRRFPKLNQFSAARISEFAGGNARLALALASRVDADETLASFTDEDLFQRLFSQRKGESADLLKGATALSLVYSFNVSKNEYGNELGVLATISELPRGTLQRDQAELMRRQLAQQRGNWRAVLPHALATRLARRALQEFQAEDINAELFKPENIRLLQSCAHRLGYLHDDDRARELALTWIQPGAPLGDIAACSEPYLVVLNQIAPVFPDVVLRIIEQAAAVPGFADRENPHFYKVTRLLSLLAYEDALFDRAAGLLLKFAETERQGEKNNSIVGMLRQLFSLYLSGTVASPARRQGFVSRLLASASGRHREIAGELLGGALRAYSWSAFGDFKFGARNRGPGWQPATTLESLAWYQGFLDLLRPMLDGADADACEWAKALVATHFRSLWTFAGCFDALEDLVRAYGANGVWPGAWRAIVRTLNLDGGRHAPRLLSRLQSLESWSAPTDIESQINAYAFVDAWSLAGIGVQDHEKVIAEYRDKVRALGRALAADYALFTRLASKIWKAPVCTPEWLGLGFAEGFSDIDGWVSSVVESFRVHAPQNANVAFLVGCIHAVYELAPEAVPGLLKRLLEVQGLGPHGVDLLVATDLSLWASAELIELAKAGDIAATRFEVLQFGHRHAAMSDEHFASLMNAISALPQGYMSALRIIVMRFFDRKKRRYEPGAEVFAATRNALRYLLRDGRDGWEASELYGLKDVLVEAFGPAAPDQEINELVSILIEGLRAYRLALSDLDEVVGAFLQVRPEALLDGMFDGQEDNEGAAAWLFRQRSGRQIVALNQVPVDRLMEWCGTDQKRFERVATYLAVYVSGSGINESEDVAQSRVHLSEHFMALLAAAPDKVPMIDAAVDQAVPMSWSNSRARIIEIRAQALAELLHYKSIDVQTRVREKLDWLAVRVAQERDIELAYERRQERRFE